MKDNSSLVSCSQNYMQINLDRRYYDSSLYTSITLRSPSCSATYSSSYITLGTILGGCGATRKDTVNHIVYENTVILRAKAVAGMITRDMDQKIKFSCSYGKNGYAGGLSYNAVSSVNATEQGFGNFSFYFSMYTDKSYSQMHYSYPVSVQLRDRLYFEVRASVADNDVVVLIDQCYSTPIMDRYHANKYYLINNRCPIDDTVAFHPTLNSRQRYSMQAYKYLANSTSVFFHCLVFLCHKSSSNSKCHYGCAGNNVNRGKRAVPNEYSDPSNMYMLDLQVVMADKESQTKGRSGSTDYKFYGLAGGFCVLVALMVGLVVKMKKMHKAAQIGPRTVHGSAYAQGVEDSLPGYTEHAPAHGEAEISMEKLDSIGVISKSKQQELFIA